VAGPHPGGVRGPLGAGERVLLVDSKRRRHLVTLVPGARFHTHAGIIEHDLVIGQVEGTSVRTGAGARYVALRPTLAELVLEMPRGAQVIYPKDLAAILMLADVYPGARVLEAGVGSGALSMALLRAGAQVVGYEIRPDFAARARKNVAALAGSGLAGSGLAGSGLAGSGLAGSGLAGASPEAYRVEERDVYEGINQSDLDRVILDLPEPWRVVGHAEGALRPGGILLAYLPSITQVTQLRDALSVSGFAMAETLEVLQRTWHVEGRSVRPDHRMVAHTGFLTHARLLVAPQGEPPRVDQP